MRINRRIPCGEVLAGGFWHYWISDPLVSKINFYSLSFCVFPSDQKAIRYIIDSKL